MRLVAYGIVILTFGAGWLTAGWILELDRIVVSRFEGQRFHVPSRVYSAPTILYPGYSFFKKP